MATSARFTRPSKAEALSKMARYCAYPERCHSEVKRKLFDLGFGGSMLDEIISELISNDFLNEQRFAREFVIGKFKNLKWGRIKIANELRMKDVPKRIIYDALEQINEITYQKVLNGLAQKKWAAMRGIKSLKKKAALQRYLAGKGFEGDLVRKASNHLYN